jgi:4-amino-4-deoxy-L-arabinose transferase-like glycosyltransferase
VEREPRFTLMAIFIVALFVRAAIGMVSSGRGEMWGLERGYEEGAYALAAGYGIVRPRDDQPRQVDLVAVADSLARRGVRLSPSNAPRIDRTRWRPATLHPPGYSLFLFGLYRTLGPPATRWARIIQAIADAASAVLIFFVGRRLAGRRAGLIAAFGSALFLPLAYLSTSKVADALTPPLLVLAFALYLRGFDPGRRVAWWVLSGVVMGALALLRPDYGALAAFFIVSALIVSRRRRALLAPSAAMILATSLVLLPWAIRNQRAIGRLSPGTTAAGLVLLQGVGQFPNPYGILVNDGWYWREAQRHGYDGVDDPGADRLLRGEFLTVARERPGLVAGDAMRRLMIALVPPYHWGFDNRFYEGHGFYDYRDSEGLGPLAALRRHPLEILRAYWDRFLFVPVSLVLLAACVIAFAIAGPRRRTAFLMLLPWAYGVIVHLPLYMTVRMMVPGVFAQMIALGCVIARRREGVNPLRPIG